MKRIRHATDGATARGTQKANGSPIVTFKADQSLLAAMKNLPNRSEFIRAAVLAALDGTCPVCRGAGRITPNQREHWIAFTGDHALEECDDCHEVRLVCLNKSKNGKQRAKGRRNGK